MAPDQLPRLCLGIPMDHRLEPLLGAGLTMAHRSVNPGGHVRTVEKYGHVLQNYGEDISNDEIEFAKWLAMPHSKGGVLIALLQPAEYQRYFSDHFQTVKDCTSLSGVHEVCMTVTGYGLDKISCFDAFPFHKIPVTQTNWVDYEEQLDQAHAVFLDMIEEKQPDVIFCCYQVSGSNKYGEFRSMGVGKTREYSVTFRGRSYTCVNGFHPSFALNHLEDKAGLRTLFILEATKAFRLANGTWRESSWMTDVRDNGAAIAKQKIDGKPLLLGLPFLPENHRIVY
jgi:hypothetical protein